MTDFVCGSQRCLCLQPRRPFANAHARIGVTLVRHRSHNLQPKSYHRYSTARCTDCFRVPITSPIIVFTSSPTCFAGNNSIAIDLFTVKDRLLLSIGHQQQSAISFCCDQVIAQWLPRFQEYVTWKYLLQFISTFGRNKSLSLWYLAPVPVFQ